MNDKELRKIGLRKPGKDEAILYNGLHGFFKIVSLDFLGKYPNNKTKTNPEPNTYDGFKHIPTYEDALMIAKGTETPPEAGAAKGTGPQISAKLQAASDAKVKEANEAKDAAEKLAIKRTEEAKTAKSEAKSAIEEADKAKQEAKAAKEKADAAEKKIEELKKQLEAKPKAEKVEDAKGAETTKK